MKISCIIPNYNDGRVARAIASVAGQTYRDKELIVVDGGSSKPEVHAIYQKFKGDISRLVSERDEGIFDALNKGVRMSTGDVICLIGSDDHYPQRDTMAEVAEHLRPEADGVCIGLKFCDAEGRVTREWFPRGVTSTRIKWGLLPPHFSLFLRRSVYERVGEFRQLYRVAADSDWLLRMALASRVRIDTLNSRYLIMEEGGNSNGSVRRVARGNREVMRIWRANRQLAWPIAPCVKLVSKVFQMRKPKADDGLGKTTAYRA